MNELIKITEKSGKQVVSARELYKSLELADGQFSRWAKSNILDNPFAVENEVWEGSTLMSRVTNSVDFIRKLINNKYKENGK